MKKTVVMFPGQGSQSSGMADPLLRDFPQARRYFDEAREVLEYDLLELIREDSSEASLLHMTQYAQPALLVTGVAIWETLARETGEWTPDCFAGHSLGEYAALVAAGALDFPTGVSLVAQRGECMQDAVAEGEGTMAVVLGLSDEQVRECCEAYAGVSVANYNAPGQVVVAGKLAAVQEVFAQVIRVGARRVLPVRISVPSHCPLMKPAAERFAKTLEKTEFHDAKVPVVQNMDAAARTDAGEIRERLLEHLYAPVQWVECVKTMHDRGVEMAVECSSAKVLCNLHKRNLPDMPAYAVFDRDSMAKLPAACSSVA